MIPPQFRNITNANAGISNISNKAELNPFQAWQPEPVPAAPFKNLCHLVGFGEKSTQSPLKTKSGTRRLLFQNKLRPSYGIFFEMEDDEVGKKTSGRLAERNTYITADGFILPFEIKVNTGYGSEQERLPLEMQENKNKVSKRSLL